MIIKNKIGLDEIFEIASYLDNDAKKIVKKAYEFAENAHKEQKRKSGEPYFIHLVATAKNLAELKMDAPAIAAGLLHDSVEDGVATEEELEREFGAEITFLVDGVTKLGKVKYQGMKRHNESLKKLFIATSKDIRVAIIKFADRLHNISTLEHVPREKQIRIATETLDIYAPLAYRLGITSISKKLEDFAFPYVYPEAFEKTKKILSVRKKQTLNRLEKVIKSLKRKLGENEILDFKSSYRIKGFYSLYKKLKRKKWDLNKIYDVAAVRIIVDDVKTCYETLGIIHQSFRPMPGRIKDFIAFPKPNGYQSIHTTVFTGDGDIIEIQIRTHDMHEEAELGAASHVGYKSHRENGKNSKNKKSDWFDKLINIFKTNKSMTSDKKNKRERHLWVTDLAETSAFDIDIDNKEIDKELGDDFFTHRIFVFTPNGDVIDIPEGSTPIDFAFMIHTDLGYKITGAIVNGDFKSLSTILQNGDIVEIQSKENSEPNIKWLEFVRTNTAKRRIKNYFEKKDKRKINLS